jgi:hypothetical protein
MSLAIKESLDFYVHVLPFAKAIHCQDTSRFLIHGEALRAMAKEPDVFIGTHM